MGEEFTGNKSLAGAFHIVIENINVSQIFLYIFQTNNSTEISTI